MRITTVQDLSQLNRQLDRIDHLQKQIDDMHRQLGAHARQLSHLDVVHAPLTLNNTVFNWTGGSGTVDWNDSSIIDKNNINRPIKAGSITGLAPNTYYWLAWNTEHSQMVARVGVDGVFQIPDNHVICQIFTGSGAQTGVVGGGGSSSSGSDLSGSRYKLF